MKKLTVFVSIMALTAFLVVVVGLLFDIYWSVAYFEDGSGVTAITYCLPWEICALP